MWHGCAVHWGLCQQYCVHRAAARHGSSARISLWHQCTLLCVCSWGWSSRASLNLLPDGYVIAPTDPRAELLPKHWQNQQLLQQVARLIKPAGCSEHSRAAASGFIHTSSLFCSASLPTTESYPDILYEIKIQAIYMSHCDPLQNRFSKHSSRSGTISMWLQIIPELC